MTPFHHVGQLVRDGLLQIPMPVVRAFFLAVPVLLLVWVLQLPREKTTPPERSSHWGANLKVWASVALIIQILVYSLL